MDKKERTTADLVEILECSDDDTLNMLVSFLEAAAEIHSTFDEVETEEEFFDFIARTVVDPIVASAYQVEDPGSCVGALIDVRKTNVATDIEARLPHTKLDEMSQFLILSNMDAACEQVLQRIDARIFEKARECGEAGGEKDLWVMEWLDDIVKIRRSPDKYRLDSTKRGIRNMLKSARQYVNRQESVVRGMRKHARGIRDIEIWYSRYSLAPAIENAKEGFINELIEICRYSDQDIAIECAKLAHIMGADAAPEDFDVSRVKRSMRQLCRARTGFSIPEVFLAALLPRTMIKYPRM